MNRQGVFITFMVFLLVVSVLALHDATMRADFKQEEKYIDEAAFNNVNNAFNNLYEEVVSLNKEGYAKEVQQRPMPFEYGFGGNSIILSQRLPVRKYILEAYVDTLNIYSIFANSEVTTDLNIVTETLQNSEWDAAAETYPDLSYPILPQCLLYDVNECCVDGNILVLRELQGGEHRCLGGFDYADLNVVDVNISINSRGCGSTSRIAGNMAEEYEDFNAAEPKPYLRITINESNVGCPGGESEDCPVTKEASGKAVIAKHFNPENFGSPQTTESLLIKCDNDDWLRVKIGMESSDDRFPVLIYNWLSNRPVDIDLNLTFDQKVDLFYFTGFSISVEKKNFPIKRSS